MLNFDSIHHVALGSITFANISKFFDLHTTRRDVPNFVAFDLLCYAPVLCDHPHFSNVDAFQLRTSYHRFRARFLPN